MSTTATAPNAREVEIDSQLAEIWGRLNAAYTRRENRKLSLAHDVGIRPVYVTRQRREVRETLAEIVALADAKSADPETFPWVKSDIDGSLEKLAAIQAEIVALHAEASPLEDLYTENQWSRFFLVQNTGGHIHSSMNCSTCHITTQFGWLPNLSGLTEADAVAAHGPLLCSVCYPTAPVEWTIGNVKAEDPNQCPGSGSYDHENFRMTSHTGSGNATCSSCGQRRVGVTSTGKLRKHKAAI